MSQEEHGAGNPRLVLSSDGHALAGSPVAAGQMQEYALTKDVTTIGSGDSQDIQLPDIDAEHARIRYDADGDEYRFEPAVPLSETLDGKPVESQGIHHADRISVGPHVLIFQRDEDASHVRSSDEAREGGENVSDGATGLGGHESEPG